MSSFIAICYKKNLYLLLVNLTAVHFQALVYGSRFIKFGRPMHNYLALLYDEVRVEEKSILVKTFFFKFYT